MSLTIPTEQVAVEQRAQPRILRGVVFSLLAGGQLIFTLVFIYRFYIISQSEVAKFDSRWIFPPIALASFVAFALEAWRSFRPKPRT